jgi:hypothetical protein
MECPKCAIALSTDFTECPHCGIVVAKYLRAHNTPVDRPAPEAADAPALPSGAVSALPVVATSAFLSATSPALSAEAVATDQDSVRKRRHERLLRAVAIPGALLLARFLVQASHGLVRMQSMWVHESGHAVMAWLCGFPAFPGPWVTTVSPERSPLFTLLLVAGLAFAGYRAWERERLFWVVASAGTLLLVLYCTLRVNHVNARQLITFAGDGGCFVLGTIMMLTVYAREDHPVRANQIRWALIVIGALAFMDAYTVWSGPIDHLPFGEDEHGISDPSVLVEMDGWNVLMLIRRYLGLARVCFVVMAAVYVVMLIRDWRATLAPSLPAGVE